MNRNLFSKSSLLVVAVLLLAVVSLSQILFKGWRLDLTDGQLYTLSEGTRGVLGKIDEPITLYFFYNRAATQGLPQIQTYAQRVHEFLEEITLAAAGKVELAVIDPEPFSDEEDRAVELGVQPVPLNNTGDNLYFGLAATNSVDDIQTIPFFQPNRAEFLEYDVAKLIYALSTPDKPTVGLLSRLDVNGGFSPQTMQRTPPWMAIAQLREFFDLQDVDPNAEQIADDIDLLLLVHPANLDSKTLYAIDQFVLRGGNLLAFVDPLAESAAPQGMGPQSDGPPPNSNLEPLLTSWGLKLSGDILGDADTALAVQTQGGQRPVYHLAMLGLNAAHLNADDVITRDIESINLGIAGILQPVAEAGTEFLPLIQSSSNAAPIPSFRVQPGMNPANLQSGFLPTGERYTVAARVRGKVKSAYGDSAPAGIDNPQHLTESQAPINVVVTADTDLLTDRFWVQVQNFLGQQIASPFAGNGDFLVNAVDNLLGSADVIGIKNRAGFSRPFERVEKMRREADARFRRTEEELQDRLRETERKLGELQTQKDESNVLVLSPEQRAELEKFRQQKLATRKELRDVRHSLNKEIDELGAKLKFINIGLVPLLVILAALAHGWWRRRHVQGANAS